MPDSVSVISIVFDKYYCLIRFCLFGKLPDIIVCDCSFGGWFGKQIVLFRLKERIFWKLQSEIVRYALQYK